jgi:hypothetical protein
MDEDVRDLVQDMERRFSNEVAAQIGRLQGALDAHMSDPYSHQPGRQEYRERFEHVGREFNERFGHVDTRLSSLEKWRWLLSGGFVLLTLESGAFLGFLPFLISHIH